MLPRPLASSGSLVGSLLLLAACGTAQRADDGAAPLSGSGVALSASSSAATADTAPIAAPTTTSAPVVAPTASASAGASAKAIPLPRVPTSPGMVWCGTVECAITTDLCCSSSLTESGRCVPKSSECSASEVFHISCDESADCGKQLCCYVPRPDPSVPAFMECRDRCEDAALETCLAGGKCKSGKACKVSDPSEGTGYCPRP